MSQPATNPRVVSFGLFELDLEARELRKSGIRIKLQEQPLQILAMLLERPGSIVTRDELKKELWSEDTFVDFDLSLNSAVKKLRQALNDDSENPRYIETLYRRGYRFIGPVNGSSDNGAQTVDSALPASTPVISISVPTAPQTTVPATPRMRLVLCGAVIVVLALIAVALLLIPSGSPRVLGYTQITHDGFTKNHILATGERLYFAGLYGDHIAVSQVSVAGGETSPVSTPFENTFALDIAANGSALLVGTFRGTNKSSEVWSVPLPGGAPRRLGDFVADSATWSRDGSQLFFSHGADIFNATSNGDQPRKITSVGSQVFDLRVSPDDRRLRFEVVDTRNGSSTLLGDAPRRLQPPSLASRLEHGSSRVLRQLDTRRQVLSF
jgi:DNA-binding winged helix-turn-helix (wHTH) protein